MAFKEELSRRERQMINVVYALGEATVADIVERISDPPSETAVRTIMRILEEKGFVSTRKKGKKNVYRPKTSRKRAARSMFNQVLDVFFDGSIEHAVASHLADPKTKINRDELKRIKELIEKAQEEDK